MTVSFASNAVSYFMAINKNDIKVKVGGIKIVDTIRANLCKTAELLFN